MYQLVNQTERFDISQCFIQEILSPIYFIIVIVIIALVVPAPFYPEVVESSGVGNVFEAPAFLANQSTIYVVPDDIATKDFIGRVGQHAAFEVSYMQTV
jgi:hypothetical protein